MSKFSTLPQKTDSKLCSELTKIIPSGICRKIHTNIGNSVLEIYLVEEKPFPTTAKRWRSYVKTFWRHRRSSLWSVPRFFLLKEMPGARWEQKRSIKGILKSSGSEWKRSLMGNLIFDSKCLHQQNTPMAVIKDNKAFDSVNHNNLS